MNNVHGPCASGALPCSLSSLLPQLLWTFSQPISYLTIQLLEFGIYDTIVFSMNNVFPVNLNVSKLWQISTQQIVFLVTWITIQWTPDSVHTFQQYWLNIWILTLYMHLYIAFRYWAENNIYFTHNISIMLKQTF